MEATVRPLFHAVADNASQHAVGYWHLANGGAWTDNSPPEHRLLQPGQTGPAGTAVCEDHVRLGGAC